MAVTVRDTNAGATARNGSGAVRYSCVLLISVLFLLMRVFTLYIGSKKPQARDELIRILSEHFPSFTVIAGEGFFRGSAEPAWMVKIASDDKVKVIHAAAMIREVLGQDGVGIETDGEYYRCSEEKCPEVIGSEEGKQ